MRLQPVHDQPTYQAHERMQTDSTWHEEQLILNITTLTKPVFHECRVSNLKNED